MSNGYQIYDQEGMYFLTLQITGWIDIFTRKIYRDILVENLQYCQQHKGLVLFGYVVMSNHVHLIAQSRTNHLSDWLRDFKSYVGKLLFDAIQNEKEKRKWMLSLFEEAGEKNSRNTNFQIWTHENHPEHLFSLNFAQQKLNYIHQNPVKAGIVEKPEHYLFSSARNYAGLSSLLDIEFITLPVISHTVKTGGWRQK